MQTSTAAPVTIVCGRRPQDIEIVLRFDPASPIARTEIENAYGACSGAW
jgi:hypothetical protein